MPPTKILIAIPFWEQDKEQAMLVARLLADLENGHSDKADVLLMSRFDCPPADKPTLDHVSRKFNTYSQVCKRRGVGWGHGSNELFFGVMDWLYSNNVAKKVPEYKAVLMFESDSCPLTPNWINALHDSWDASQRGPRTVKVYGPLLSQPEHPLMPKGISHINANALYAGDLKFLKTLAREIGGCNPQGGYDWHLAPRFMKIGWKDCPQIKSWWRSINVTPAILDNLIHQGVVMMHGFKDNSLIELIRSRYL
jgi:hypothetical protein